MLIRASLLSERFSKREPAAIRIFSLACCLDHHDTSATQLTDKIPRVRPRKHDDHAAAQRLTLTTAQEAGFPEIVRLLEEPQAAFYSWREQHDFRQRVS